MPNPYLQAESIEDVQPDPSAASAEVVVEAAVPAAKLSPGGQAGIELPAEGDRLAVRRVPDVSAGVVYVVGVHGGAGESTLATLLGSRRAGRSWPIHEESDPPARVVVVARTHTRGLEAARSALKEWAAGGLPVELLGLVLVADAPGRRPKQLRDLVAHVAGGAPRVWELPWVEEWRLGEPVSLDSAPRAARKFASDVRRLLADEPMRED